MGVELVSREDLSAPYKHNAYGGRREIYFTRRCMLQNSKTRHASMTPTGVSVKLISREGAYCEICKTRHASMTPTGVGVKFISREDACCKTLKRAMQA